MNPHCAWIIQTQLPRARGARAGAARLAVSEIRLRACMRIGELARELDKAPPGPEPEDMSQRRDITPKKRVTRSGSRKRSFLEIWIFGKS